jgi:hypothetical protein
MQTKICTKCGETKPVSAFHLEKRRVGYRPRCKDCHAEDAAKYRAEHADDLKAYNDNWYAENKEAKNRKAREWQRANPEKVKSYQQKYRTTHGDLMLARRKLRDKLKRSTPQGRLENNIKAAIHRGLTAEAKRRRPTFALLGYTVDDLRSHLEKQFQPGMTWENYGEWHVDHKVPLAAHNYETPDDIDFKKAWALNNLQPLWAIDNHSKGAKLSKPFQPSLALAVNDNIQKEIKHG